ncbi:MAG: methionyl-tRNA formyltransferase, partial [Pseudomonadota bacterium]
MRIVFMGTPEFASTALGALLDGQHEVAAVYTRAPKPSGRGKREKRSPVHELADIHGIPVKTPKSFRSEEAIDE